MMRQTITALVTTAGLSFLTLSADAATLFSIETDTDELVKIDSQTGVIEIVGALDFDATSTDLASFEDRLFVLDTVFRERVDIFEIAPFTATTISSAQVTFDENPVVHAEGLTNIDEQLIIVFSANGGDVFSESLGNLALTGKVTNAVSLMDDADITPVSDTDALGSDGTSKIFSGDDTGGGVGPLSIFDVDRQADFLSLVETLEITGKDLVFDDENFFLLSSSFATTEAFLAEISVNGVIESSISLGNGKYNGLAVANEIADPAESVPEPTSTAGLLLAIAPIAKLLKSQPR